MIEQNKKFISEIDRIFDSDINVILFGEKGSGTTTTAIDYALKKFDTYFIIDSQSKNKIEIELNRSIELNQRERISLYDKIKAAAKSSRILIILDQVENFSDIEDLLIKFDKNVNFLATTHNFLDRKQNFVQLDQPQINFSLAVKYLTNKTNGFFHSKKIEHLVEILSKKKEFLTVFNLSKIVKIIKFYSSFYTNQDLLIKICNSIKSPVEFFFESFNADAFEIFFTMLFFDHKFINTNLIDNYFESKDTSLYLVKKNLRKLLKMSLISSIEKYNQNGIAIHDLVFEAALKHVNKDHHNLKSCGNFYESVLNFYFDNFGSSFQEGINFYCHVEKILSPEFNFLSTSFNDLKKKRVDRLRSNLLYKLALFRFNHLIDYKECLRLCFNGKSYSEIESQFDELIKKCQEFDYSSYLNENDDLGRQLEEQQLDLIDQSQSRSKIKLPVFMDTDETYEWLKQERISKAIVQYLTPIKGSKLMDYFVFITNNNIFFDLVLKQEIPNATDEEINYFGKCLKKLFTHPLNNNIILE